MIAYELPPIDWWNGTIEFSPSYEAEIARSEAPSMGAFALRERYEHAARLTNLHQQASELFQRLGWEGDGDWRCGALPGEGNTELWISVKQENNGTTYVLTPMEMPWLGEFAFNTAS